MDNSEIVIVGAGAMGSLFGGLLSEGGLNVTLLDPWQEHITAIKQHGLRIIGHGGDRSIQINATSDAASINQADLVLVQCKAVHNQAALNSVKHLFSAGSKTLAISFQNGLGNEEQIGEIIGEQTVLGGLTAQGANIEAPGVVRNHAELPSYIGEMDGSLSERSRYWANLLSKAGLATTASADIKREIWKKLLANVAISPTSAIPNLTIGQVFSNPTMTTIAYAALDEALSVAQAQGIAIDPDNAREVLQKIASPKTGTPQNKSSLCIDILKQRACEIDYINGAIVRLAQQHGIATPVNKTLVGLVKGLQSHYLA